MFEEHELGRVEAVGEGSLPEGRSAGLVGIGKVDFEQIIGRAHFAAEGDATACAGTSAGASTGTTGAGAHGRRGADLSADCCRGEAPLADHEDQICLIAADRDDVAVPVVESFVNVGDGIAVVWIQSRVKFLAVLCLHVDVARLLKGGGKLVGFFGLGLEVGECGSSTSSNVIALNGFIGALRNATSFVGLVDRANGISVRGLI